MENKKLEIFSSIEFLIGQSTGRILTIIDSSISEERQNKAVKIQIKGELEKLRLDIHREIYGN